MGMGSTLAVEEAESVYRENCAQLIARYAAEYVAAGDMDRHTAIQTVTEYLRRERLAMNDETGAQAVENALRPPSKVAPANQITALAYELMDAARAAAETL